MNRQPRFIRAKDIRPGHVFVLARASGDMQIHTALAAPRPTGPATSMLTVATTYVWSYGPGTSKEPLYLDADQSLVLLKGRTPKTSA